MFDLSLKTTFTDSVNYLSISTTIRHLRIPSRYFLIWLVSTRSIDSLSPPSSRKTPKTLPKYRRVGLSSRHSVIKDRRLSSGPESRKVGGGEGRDGRGNDRRGILEVKRCHRRYSYSSVIEFKAIIIDVTPTFKM